MIVLAAAMPNLIEIVTKGMSLRNYSRKTIAAYTRVYKDIYAVAKRPLGTLQETDLKDYLYQKQQSSWSAQSIAFSANALNSLYTQISTWTQTSKFFFLL